MASTTRVPRKNGEFNTYINNAYNYLIDTPDGAAVPNFDRLGLSTAQKNQWGSYKNDWNEKYAKTSNPATSTRPLREERNTIKKDFIAFSELVLKIIEVSENITEDDRSVFNIKKRDRTPTPKAKITTMPYPEMLPKGGGTIRIVVRVQNDASRASMHPDADSIEMAYTIGDTPPDSADEADKTDISSKALYIFDAGQGNATKRLYAFFRWKNESDKSKSGPWSSMVQVVIA